ncbi:MAG: hypothetical protein NWF07_03995 [Candidatus Bathyarchaeota archaeon]|nr:hypothetical protein [Candidatus Bathyarchaeota archaeon]
MDEERVKKAKEEFDQQDYPEKEYFKNPICREETRKYLLSETSTKIDQHIKYFLGLIATAYTLIQSEMSAILRSYFLISTFILLVYVFSRIFYWSAFYDYTLTSAPKKYIKELDFFHQDNLLSRYYWAVQFRSEYHKSRRRRLAYYAKQWIHITNVLGIWILFTFIYSIIFLDELNMFVQTFM